MWTDRNLTIKTKTNTKIRFSHDLTMIIHLYFSWFGLLVLAVTCHKSPVIGAGITRDCSTAGWPCSTGGCSELWPGGWRLYTSLQEPRCHVTNETWTNGTRPLWPPDTWHYYCWFPGCSGISNCGCVLMSNCNLYSATHWQKLAWFVNRQVTSQV